MSDLSQASFAARLRALTPARVGLGRTGVSQPLRDVLAFQLAHARARDAVHARLDAPALATGLRAGVSVLPDQPLLSLHSAAPDRATYLQRPDLGRKLDDAGRALLSGQSPVRHDLAIVIADGLSALAVERQVPHLLQHFLPRAAQWKIAPLCIVEQGRVAIGDEIGELLDALVAVVLIGERPGLSSPDSLGAYITWNPRTGRTDAERVCISNIRAEGLGHAQAAEMIAKAVEDALRFRLTGVALGQDRRALDGR